MSGTPDDDSEKPHDPSPRRLEDARKKGEVPRSLDLAAASVYAAMLVTGMALGTQTVHLSGETLMVLLDQSDTISTMLLEGGGSSGALGIASRLSAALAPWFLIPALAALGVFIAQRAIVFAPTKLSPKLSRISPASNFQNKFGRNGLFEFFKSLVKLVVFSIVMALFLWAELPRLLSSIYLSPAGAAALLGDMTLRFLVAVFLVAVVIGAIDFLWQRSEHIRKHRMSHQELKEESKQTEGDPHMKQERRQRGYDIATNRMLADVHKADVVIVNPEHFAVALKWSREPGAAPVCVGKGTDEIAARIRNAASEAGVGGTPRPQDFCTPPLRLVRKSTQTIMPLWQRPSGLPSRCVRRRGALDLSDREGNLIRVAEMVADRAGADLARHMEMVRQLEVKIAALRVAGATGTDFNFCQAGGDRRWKEWRMQELHRLNRALAALKAREPALREVSGRATIRREVLLKMTGPSHQSPSRAG